MEWAFISACLACQGGKLSGGQQQRVALARAMLKNGTIYLLDEPTTALDGVVAQQLQRTLDTLCTHATTIFITHHLNDLKTAHQVVPLLLCVSQVFSD